MQLTAKDGRSMPQMMATHSQSEIVEYVAAKIVGLGIVSLASLSSTQTWWSLGAESVT